MLISLDSITRHWIQTVDFDDSANSCITVIKPKMDEWS